MGTLRCENLCKSFGGVVALDKVSLRVPPRSRVAIIGPNGAGKTTLLNVFSGFCRPDSGHCYLEDHELTHLSPDKIARLGLVRTFQEVRLVQRVSVLENVLLARPGQRGERLLSALVGTGVRREEAKNRQEALRILGFVNLVEAAVQPAGELSHGQQRLLALACCLAVQPRVLLLDEPVSGVDGAMRRRILELLPRLLEEMGIGLVSFIEHDLPAVQEVADEVIVMDHGRIIAQGKPSEVLELPEVIEAYLA
jgi:branched-chain amino acid transport system ATP-binding protein